jgi:hypothetical protein
MVAFSRRAKTRISAEAGEFAGADEDAGEHDPIEAAGVGVAEGRVVAAKKLEPVGQGVLGAVGEGVVGAAHDLATKQEVSEEAVPRDFSEAHDDSDLRQSLDLGGEMSCAVANLLRGGLVSGGCAADDRGDPRVAEAEAVVAGDGVWLGGEAEFVEDRIHEISGAIAGEGAPGAVGSVSSGGKPEDEDASFRIAESGDRARPVGVVDIGAAAGFSDASAVLTQTGAELAAGDRFADAKQVGGRGQHGKLAGSLRQGALGGEMGL